MSSDDQAPPLGPPRRLSAIMRVVGIPPTEIEATFQGVAEAIRNVLKQRDALGHIKADAREIDTIARLVVAKLRTT